MWFLYACAAPEPTGKVDDPVAETGVDLTAGVGSVGIVPAAPTALDTLGAELPPGVATTVTYAWTVDGASVGTGTTLAGMFAKGDTVGLTVTGADGSGAATSVVIGDAAPAATATITEADDGSLTCTADAADPDGDDYTLSYRWSPDVDGPVVDVEAAAQAGAWTCTATVSDGELSTDAVATFTATGPVPNQYTFEKVLDLFAPADVVATPDGRLLVAELDGSLDLVDPTTPEVQGSLALFDHPDDLIAIALAPGFGDGAHDWLYAWGNTSCDLLRYPLTLDPLAVGDPQTVLDFDCGAGDGHTGGDLVFWSGEGTDVLYLVAGPGKGSDPQDTSTYGNKLLAMTVDDETGEGQPAFDLGYENDFIAAIGLRNPWRVVDCGAALCLVDPGNQSYEELDLYTHAGSNFGFPYFEGPGDGTYDDPTVWWQDEDTTWLDEDRTGTVEDGFVNAPGLGVRLDGEGYGGRLDGWVLFSDVYDGWVRAVKVEDDGTSDGVSVPLAHRQFLMSMVEVGGVAYAVDMGGGLYRLTTWADRSHITATTLEDTHFAEATPFDVRYALWSNGADKSRSVWVPPGETIDTTDEAWVFPDGTEVFKTFALGGENVETRMLLREEGRWLGTTFLWEGGVATRYDGSRQTLLAADGSSYTIPGETSCADCHDSWRGREWPLGLTPMVLGDEGLAQVAPLLDTPPGPAPTIPGTSLDQEARGFLDINCGFCHTAGGLTNRTTVLTFDLDAEADDPNLLGQVAQYWHANPNLEDGKPIVFPEDPSESVLTKVMQSTEMPYLSVWTPDTDAITTINDWIATLE